MGFVEKLHGLAKSIIDFFTICRAAAVIGVVPQRRGWSAFSAIPAMAKQLPYLVVYCTAWQGESRFEAHANVTGPRPYNFFYFCHEGYDHNAEIEAFSIATLRN